MFEDSNFEILESDIVVDNQVTIWTSSEDEQTTDPSVEEQPANLSSEEQTIDLKFEEQTVCMSVEEEAVDLKLEEEGINLPMEHSTVESIPNIDVTLEEQTVCMSVEEEAVDLKLEEEAINPPTPEGTVESIPEIEIQDNLDSEWKVRNENGLVVVECTTEKQGDYEDEENTLDKDDDNHCKTTLKSVVGKAYKIPKRKRDSRARSRSPLRSRSPKQSNNRRMTKNGRSKSRGCSSNSDEDDMKERYERYRSERRTPMRRDDRRKRRKYSSCSDDEYDYYRFSRKRNDRYSDIRKNQQSPVRSNYEHDYTKVNRKGKDNERYQRSASTSLRGPEGHDRYRENRPRKSAPQNVPDEENVHERLTELATPVPYDIEQERKIGFLCRGKGTKGSVSMQIFSN